MDKKTEGTFAIVASILVIFTAMLDPRISVALSIIALAGFAFYSFIKK